MRGRITAALVAGAAALVLGASSPAAAAPPTVLGSFVHPHQRAHQPHRVYFRVAAGHGAKECAVTLHGRTQQVDLGTDRVSDLTNMFYLRRAGASDALAQALAASSPTWRIRCSH